MLRAIIFDLAGVYLSRGIKIAFRERFPSMLKISLGEEELVELLDKNLYAAGFMAGKISERRYWRLCEKSLGIRLDAQKMSQTVLESFKEQKPVISLVKKLRSKYRVLLLSDMPSEWMDWLEKKFGISKNFDDVFVSGYMGAAKPKSLIYKKMLQKTGLKQSECVFIDDRWQNLEYPKKIGMKTILFENVVQLRREFKLLGIRF